MIADVLVLVNLIHCVSACACLRAHVWICVSACACLNVPVYMLVFARERQKAEENAYVFIMIKFCGSAVAIRI